MARGWRVPSLFLASLFVALSSAALSQTRPTKNILVLFFNSQTLPANIIAFEQLRALLEGLPDLDNQLFAEYVDDYRLKNGIPAVAKAIQEKYRGHRFDLVITVGRAPLELAVRYGSSLFPDVPVVFFRMEQRLLLKHLPPTFTGVVNRVDFVGTVNLALRLHPKTQHIFYISGSSPMEGFFRSAAREELAGLTSADITYLSGLPLNDLLPLVGSLPNNSLIIYQEMLQDGAGQSYISTNVSSLVAAAANAPVYGLYTMHFGRGIVGGVLNDPAANSRKGAELALRVLRGAPLSQLPIQRAPSVAPVLDWRQLQRWHISERLVPAGSVVLFREPTTWERYRWYVIGAAALVALQSGLIVALVIQGKKQRKLGRAVRSLSGRLVVAQDDERKRIAGEIHDDIGQRLALLCCDLDFLSEEPLDSKDRAEKKAACLSKRLHEISDDLQDVARGLHRPVLEFLPLSSALRGLCNEVSHRSGLQIDFLEREVPPELAPGLKACIFRIAQEGLTNVVKHSDASWARITLDGGQNLRLVVEDNGKGFNSDEMHETTGIGIMSMQDRLSSFGGVLRLRSRPGAGTFIEAKIDVSAGSGRDPSLHSSSKNR